MASGLKLASNSITLKGSDVVRLKDGKVSGHGPMKTYLVAARHCDH